MKKQLIRDTLKTVEARGAHFNLNTDNDLAKLYSGDELIIALTYRSYLLETTDFGNYICGMTLSNASAKTFRKLNKPKVLDIKNPCMRCDGTGLMPFKHVKGGVCFSCKGSGSSK